MMSAPMPQRLPTNPPDSASLRRVLVVGPSGCGKSVAAALVAGRLGLEHVELDRIQWRDGWTKAPRAEIEAAIRDAAAGPAWAIDGNLGAGPLLDGVAARADAVLWLDYRLTLVLRRLGARSVRRCRRRETLWGTDNRETFRLVFMSHDSPLLWTIRQFPRRRRDYVGLLAGPSGGKVARFRSPRDFDAWAARLPAAPG